MKCYQCGGRLSDKDFCTGCGADVTIYKRIMFASNRFYNQGLEKAGVRDLSGAIDYLRQSLKLNKNHIEARNLLGLVYYEMGEAVSALSEWVISKNLRPDKNIADDYINMIQSNPNRLESINQTIKKYNQALSYSRQGSLDLAVIQLKKVLSLNGNYVSAHQLLALLYIETEEWDKAKKELLKCQKIDANNTNTLRYLELTEKKLMTDDSQKGKKKGIKEDVVKYQSGNETIIQPVNKKESKGFATLLNLGLGLLIGVAGAYFLILPARIQSANSAVQNELRTISTQMDSKTSTIEELEQKLKDLTTSNDALKTDLESYAGKSGQSADYLMQAAGAYLSNPDNMEPVIKAFDQIPVSGEEKGRSQAFTALYEELLKQIGPTVAKKYYDAGYDQYKKEMYEEAAVNLSKAFEYDANNGDALLYLANCYRNLNNREKAVETYQKILELFPATEKARKAQNFLEELGVS